MHDQRFFDQILTQIETGAHELGLPILAGQMFASSIDQARWPSLRETYRAHPLHRTMLEDPYIARCVEKPRGYAGDAVLIDMIYDRRPPQGTSERGAAIFDVTIGFPVAEAVRLRRDFAEDLIGRAHAAGQRVLSLACGHFREGDGLVGKDLSGVVLVDQDPLSLARVRDYHGGAVTSHEANVFAWLRGAVSRGEEFDLVYTLGLTDYLDDRAMTLLHRMVHAVLAPGGRFILANFVPHHLASGWMDAVMDWHLIYREPEDLAGFAAAAGFAARTWLDPTGSIAWCDMVKPA